MNGTQPALEVSLHHGDRSTNAVAILDSGSIYTIFSPEYAELIGIDDVTTGHRERVSTLAGSRDVYLFDLEIQLLAAGERFGAQIGFFAARAARNILGRNVVFASFEIGFRESAGQLHLRFED